MSNVNTYRVKAADGGVVEFTTPVEVGEFGRLVRRLHLPSVSHANKISITFLQPASQAAPNGPWADAYLAKRRSHPGAAAYVGYTMFETDRIDPRWVTNCNSMDEIWVPSEFNRQTFVQSGVEASKVHLVPLGVDANRYTPGIVTPMTIAGARGFNFLSIFQWSKHKGYDLLVRAYAETFTADDDVALVIRTYGYGPSGASAAEGELRRLLMEACPDPSRPPHLIVLGQRIPDAEMPALYAACDAFVLPSRGEGWGIPYMEAMASGLPTIGTRWSGNTSFMTDSNSFLIDTEGLVDVCPGDAEYPFCFWGHRMAQPSLQQLKSVMRQVFEDRFEGATRGLRAREDVSQRWSRDAVSAAAVERLKVLSRRPAKPAQAPAKLMWSAPLMDPSGYADEARNFVTGLDRVGIPVRAVPISWSNRVADIDAKELAVLERLMARDLSSPYVHVQHIFPPAFQRDQHAMASIGRSMFETDRIPADWVERCNAMDEVWVPSNFNIETFERSGVHRSKLHKLPGAFDARKFREKAEPLPLGPSARGFRFLSIFDWTLRKGWDVLLRAFAEEFTNKDDVTLILKVYSSYGATDDELRERIRSYIASIGLSEKDSPSIQIVPGTLSDRDLRRLYAAADAYVMPSRGEGWGRPYMEAMACGLPTIGTNWSGNTEFMNHENSYLLNYELQDVSAEAVAEAPHFAGHRWAEPSVPHLRELMREVFENRVAARAKGQRARQYVMERYDRPVVARQIAAELERLLKPTPVVWEGSQFVHHSLAHINREVCLGLINSKQVDLSIIPYEAHQFGAEADRRFDALAARFTAAPGGDASVHVRHQWPPRFDAPESGAWVMIQPWEFGGLPAEWIAPMRDQVDEIWVPSNWVRECYINSGIPADKVVVIPNGVDLQTYSPDGPKYPLRTRKTFKFLFVGGTIGRKGIDVLVETYLSTFTAADDVCLVLKAVGTRTAYAGSSIESELERIAAIPGMAEIELISDDLTDAEVASLYRAADALVHPYRGEGFGMPIAEAMACGLPAVVTGYGAALDFCDASTAYLIPARMNPVADNQTDLPPSSIGYWLAEPDRRALAQLMRHVVDNPASARTVGARGRERMQAYGWQHVSARYLERLRVLAGRTPLRLRQVEPVRLDGRRSVAFLHHPRWSDAHWEQVLASYCRTFSSSDDVTLVLLQDPDQGVPQATIVERVNAALAAHGLDSDAAPDLLLVPDRLDDARLSSTYAAVDCLVPNGDAAELARAQHHGIRVLQDLHPSTWRAAA